MARKTRYPIQRIFGSAAREPIQCEIQIEYRYSGAAKDPPLRPLRASGQQTANDLLVKAARVHDARKLQSRVRGADVRIEPAPGSGHRVDGDFRVGRQAVGPAILIRQLPYVSDEFGMKWAEIGA